MRALLVAVVLVVVAVFGLGLYMGWFQFGLRRNPDTDKVSGVTFKVDQKKIGEDAKRTREGIRNLGQRLKERVSKGTEQTHEAQGQLMKVDEPNHQLTIKTAANETLTLHTGAATKIRRNEVEVKLNALMEGDRLQVRYKDENGKHVAETVTVVAGS